MNNKYIRFLLLDSNIQIRIAVFFAIWIIVFFEGNAIKKQEKELTGIKREHELVLAIPNMEKVIKANTIIVTEPVQSAAEQVVKVEFILKGMTIKQGIPYALIDDNIYKEGDSLGEYVIMKISRAGVVMLNSSPRETKQLYFIEPPAPTPPGATPANPSATP